MKRRERPSIVRLPACQRGRVRRRAPNREVALRSPLLVTAAALLACLLAAGCARNQKVKPPDVELMKQSLEYFHRYLRWGDFRSAQKYVAPERRFEFLKGVLEAKDDENLKVTDYELHDAQLLGRTAQALSKLTWHRLPSVTTRTDVVVTHWEYRDGSWFIVGIENGPITLETKPGPAEEPAPAP